MNLQGEQLTFSPYVLKTGDDSSLTQFEALLQLERFQGSLAGFESGHFESNSMMVCQGFMHELSSSRNTHATLETDWNQDAAQLRKRFWSAKVDKLKP